MKAYINCLFLAVSFLSFSSVLMGQTSYKTQIETTNTTIELKVDHKDVDYFNTQKKKGSVEVVITKTNDAGELLKETLVYQIKNVRSGPTIHGYKIVTAELNIQNQQAPTVSLPEIGSKIRFHIKKGEYVNIQNEDHENVYSLVPDEE